MTLKQQLIKAFNLTEDQFGTHESDLYICPKASELQAIKEHLQYNNRAFELFIGAKGSDWQGKTCIDIPFGYFEEFVQKKSFPKPPTLELRYIRANNDFCRVYYRSKANYLYCFQEVNHTDFEFLSCSKDGEPESPIPFEAIKSVELAKGQDSTEMLLNKFLCKFHAGRIKQ